MKAEKFPDSSLQVVPLDGIAHLLADNNPQTRPAQTVGTEEYQEKTGGVTPPFSCCRKEFKPTQQPIIFGKGWVRTLTAQLV